MPKKTSIPTIVQSPVAPRKRLRSELGEEEEIENSLISFKKQALPSNVPASTFSHINHQQSNQTPSHSTQQLFNPHSNHYHQVNALLRECHFLRLRRQQN